ncbi:MAG: HesA/MoeB/ThiF family protein [Desulfobacteraceae bacterium]|nr:HesA/MoeB/ThiF family protein [Desulfobacteraceae bacterium]
MLSVDERKRYDRQIMIRGVGEEGQERLKHAKIFITGAGGLGSPAAIYLTAAGVGKIRVVDHDNVELSNLNRQVLHWDEDIGRSKVDSATEKLKKLNRAVEIEAIEKTITKANVFQLVADSDLIVDAMDNLPTRYLLNKAAVERNIPFFHGAVYGFEGRAMTIIPGKTACLRCVYHGVVPGEKFPVIGVAPGVIGCIQATEVIKYIVGIGELLTNRFLIYDGLNLTFTELRVKKDPNCEDCGQVMRKK